MLFLSMEHELIIHECVRIENKMVDLILLLKRLGEDQDFGKRRHRPIGRPENEMGFIIGNF